jgi:hypothetical protein
VLKNENKEVKFMGTQGRHNAKKPKLTEAQKTDKATKKGEKKK